MGWTIARIIEAARHLEAEYQDGDMERDEFWTAISNLRDELGWLVPDRGANEYFHKLTGIWVEG